MKVVSITRLYDDNGKSTFNIAIYFMDVEQAERRDALGFKYLQVLKINKIYQFGSGRKAYEEGMLINNYKELNFYKRVGCYVFGGYPTSRDKTAMRFAVKLMFEAQNENI